MGREKDKELQRQYAQRKQEERRTFLRNISLCAAGLATASGLGAYAWHRTKTTKPAPAADQSPAKQNSFASEQDLSTYTHPDVAEVTVHRPGRQPIIFIPWLHPLPTTQGNMFVKESMDSITRVRTIVRDLHDAHGINGMVTEGLRETDCEKLMRGGEVLDQLAEKSDLWTKEYGAMTQDRRWVLCGSTREGIANPIQLLKYDSYKRLDLVLKDFDKRGWAKSKEAMAPHLQDAAQEISVRVFAPYVTAIENYLAQDPGAQKAHAHQLARDDGFIEAAERALTKGAKGCFILVGAGHEPNLVRLLSTTSHPYAVVRPKGMDREYLDDPEHSRKSWLQQAVPFGKYLQIHGTGFTADIRTGLLPTYQRLGILPPDNTREISPNAQGMNAQVTAPAQGNTPVTDPHTQR